MKTKNIFLTLILLLFITLSFAVSGICQSLTFHSELIGFHVGGQLTFDLYKPFASCFLNLKRHQPPVALQQGEEIDIYKKLGRQIFFPGYLLFQTTAYPLSALSSYLETDYLNSFNKFQLINDINILRSIGAGFEEPYAFSVFLGNILFLAYYDSYQAKRKQSGSALAGFLITTGRHQIYNNIYIHDKWYQFELMLIGNLNEPRIRRLSWNFRVGAKLHENRLLRDVFTLSIERSHTDWRQSGWSFAKNSVIKYQGHFPMPNKEDKNPSASQLFSYGKKFPLSLFNKKVFIILSVGFRWERVRYYNHDLKQFDDTPSNQFIWIIQPNIEF